MPQIQTHQKPLLGLAAPRVYFLFWSRTRHSHRCRSAYSVAEQTTAQYYYDDLIVHSECHRGSNGTDTYHVNTVAELAFVHMISDEAAVKYTLYKLYNNCIQWNL